MHNERVKPGIDTRNAKKQPTGEVIENIDTVHDRRINIIKCDKHIGEPFQLFIVSELCNLFSSGSLSTPQRLKKNRSHRKHMVLGEKSRNGRQLTRRSCVRLER